MDNKNVPIDDVYDDNGPEIYSNNTIYDEKTGHTYEKPKETCSKLILTQSYDESIRRFVQESNCQKCLKYFCETTIELKDGEKPFCGIFIIDCDFCKFHKCHCQVFINGRRTTIHDYRKCV